jgi:hypothetical protein
MGIAVRIDQCCTRMLQADVEGKHVPARGAQSKRLSFNDSPLLHLADGGGNRSRGDTSLLG